MDAPIVKQFAIYARRSSDEGSEKQYKSIPDQLTFCHELAEKEGITVPDKYIFTESASAKRAGNRPIFDKLLALIRKGDIDGIIAWHPDRLSRNMLEAGIIIDLIDVDKIKDLKFCTHHFDNTAAGKMMLGILFAISKEYSDRLSVNIARGIETNLDEGKSVGTYKWGYVRNDDGYYDPHPQFYDIVERCWRMRLDGATYGTILSWIAKMDCQRIVESKDEDGNKVTNTYTITRTTLTRIFKDPLYYGVLRQKLKGRIECKTLSEHYADFKPMVMKEEWETVQQTGRSKVKMTKQRYPFRDNLIACSCGATCYPTTGRGSGGKLYLYIVCRANAAHRQKREPYRLRSKVVLEAIAESLRRNFKPTKANYERYVETMRKAVENDICDGRKRRAILTRQKTAAEKKLENLVLSVFGKTLDATEDAVYNRRKFTLETKIKQCEADCKRLKEDGLLQSFSYEEFSNFLRNADQYWKKANAEQKHALARFLFSNITVGDGKVLALAYKSLIKSLFVIDGGHPAKKFEPVGGDDSGLERADKRAPPTPPHYFSADIVEIKRCPTGLLL